MIGVIVNARARGVRKTPALSTALASILRQEGEVIETDSLEALARAMERFASQGVDLLAVCGGDGTGLYTMTEAVRVYGRTRLPTLALLGGGTLNTIARNLKIQGRPEALLAQLVAARGAGVLEAREHDTLEVNGRIGFLFAAAMGARFLEAYYASPRPGPKWAALLAIRTALSSLVAGPFAARLFSPVSVDLIVDARRSPVRMPRLLIASTVPDVGLGMKVAWRAGSEPSRFHLVASALSTPEMALQLDRVRSGRPLFGADHHDQMAGRVEARFGKPEPFTLDGELFHAQEISIVIGPRLRIARSPD